MKGRPTNAVRPPSRTRTRYAHPLVVPQFVHL